jgi:hypothetical protein
MEFVLSVSSLAGFGGLLVLLLFTYPPVNPPANPPDGGPWKFNSFIVNAVFSADPLVGIAVH